MPSSLTQVRLVLNMEPVGAELGLRYDDDDDDGDDGDDDDDDDDERGSGGGGGGGRRRRADRRPPTTPPPPLPPNARDVFVPGPCDASFLVLAEKALGALPELAAMRGHLADASRACLDARLAAAAAAEEREGRP